MIRGGKSKLERKGKRERWEGIERESGGKEKEVLREA